ncbi:type VI secretion protein [Massilia sp. WF1]|uniref:type VI secretion system baseplate subunit TssF n=1 Tax=unclassified Massilia TaxID=2609279 RepID=UPI00064B43A1|nr:MULTISPECIES: type VI secretion system baseplate subunit TssF [unclassified Massilia]ALK96794.1 type VI secretion protein [Massilia sp. WG5]KLU38137.1 type VI secretion protein [Massilia sp. WF1]
MDELFAQYERELVTMRQLCREYAERYPKVAAKLQIGGDACDDPHVERLIQSVALLCARVSKRLDDAYPQFTEALLNLLFPHYLRPFPSCAIIRFLPTARGAGGGTGTVARGSLLESAPVRGVNCKFQTAYDVTPSPAAIASAWFDAVIRAPSSTRLAPGVAASVGIEFESAGPISMKTSPLRVYLDGDASFCAALRDALFMRTASAYVQAGADGAWLPLAAMPISPVGFTDDDALIPFDARSHRAYRILAEYFAFPEKFNFVDIDLAALCARLPADCTRFTLHLGLAEVPPGSDQARMLAGLSAQSLLAGCTPVVNLFRQPGVPIDYSQQTAEYSVLAHPAHAAAYEVYSVDRVHMVQQRDKDIAPVEFRPFYALRHGESDARKGRYWILRRDDTLAATSPGHEKVISLVDIDGAPLAVEKTTLSIDLTCTNRDLPCLLKSGAASSDLSIPGATEGAAIRFLRRPTRPHRLANGQGAHWRLISHLTLNHHSLATEGADGLREMLSLYDFTGSAVSRRQIAGIVGLEHAETVAWLRHKRGASLAHGTEVRLTIDEEAVVGAGLHLFIQVIDQFFALYVQMNSFIELVILSHQSGEELFRCKPRSGSMPLS